MMFLFHCQKVFKLKKNHQAKQKISAFPPYSDIYKKQNHYSIWVVYYSNKDV
jgi:hypothetical protein